MNVNEPSDTKSNTGNDRLSATCKYFEAFLLALNDLQFLSAIRQGNIKQSSRYCNAHVTLRDQTFTIRSTSVQRMLKPRITKVVISWFRFLSDIRCEITSPSLDCGLLTRLGGRLTLPAGGINTFVLPPLDTVCPLTQTKNSLLKIIQQMAGVKGKK